MKWRKLMSGILSAALLVTSITPTAAAVEEVPVDVAEEVVGETADTANLLAEFTFDVGAAEDGGNAAILAGSGFDYVENGEGKAASFNGTNQSVLIGKREDGSALLAGLEEATISFDVKPETSGSHDWVYFVAPDENSQTYKSEHYLGGLIQDSGNFLVERYNSTNQDRPAAASGSVTMGAWSHVDVVVEEGQTTVYVNGVAGTPVASEVKLSDIVGNNGIFQIGKGNWDSGEYFKGQLDNFRVYDAALSADAVKTEYETGAAATPAETPGLEESLLLYYDFVLQNSYATSIPDASGNEMNGTITRNEGAAAGTYTISDVNLYGKTVKALELPGGDDNAPYLQLPDNILSGLNAVTISMWVNLSTDHGYQRIWDIGSGTDKYMYLLSDGANKGFEGYASAITTSGWSNEQGVSKGTNIDKNRWVLTTVVLDGSNMSLYENGLQVGETVDTGIDISALAETTNNYIGYGQFGDTPTKGKFAEVKIFDRALTADEISSLYDVTDEGIVSADKDELTLGDTSAVTEDFELPSTGINGSAITWTSENSAIVIDNGVARVTRPATEDGDASGTLTATITYGEAQDTVAFDVTVAAVYTDQQIVDHDAAAVKAAVGDLSAIMSSFDVPTAGDWGSEITWTSDNSAIQIEDGVAAVTRPAIGEENAAGAIKAEITYGEATTTVELDAVVLAYAEAVEITGNEEISVTTRVGIAPTLPNWVTVTYSDGSTNKLKASWPAYIDASEYAEAGTFEVEGSIVGQNWTITATVTVVDEAEAVKVAVSESFDLSDISLDKIGEDGSILTQNRDRDIAYLKLLDNDRMLYNFRKTFGVDTKGASPLGGWDEPTGLLRGHSTGHYISALSLAYASTGDEELKTKLDEMVSEMHKLQQMSQGNAADFVTAGVLTANWSTDPSEWGEGFISAYSPDQFALLEQYVPYGSPDSGIWAPYYTMHKLLAGFLDAYNYGGNEEALEVAKALGKWAINRLSVLPQEQLTKMWDMYIAGEFGGFNESLAKLYLYTGDETFIEGAKLFDNTTFFDNLALNIDDIAGRHANQHIPQIIGALEIYKATAEAGSPESYYYDVASNFWQMVVSRYAYSIGGVGSGEAFTEPYQQANNIVSDRNCETCAAYNMLKLTKELNNFDPDNAEYMDYYERTLYNQILASQTPNVTNSMHNGTTYMLPIGPGQRREYGGDYDSFSCCHGTGMENHVKYQEAAYVKTDDTLYVGLYLPSTVTWDEMGVSVKQETVFPSETSKFTVSGDGTKSFTMKLRVPYWATNGMTVKVNGTEVDVDAEVSSYVALEGIKSGDEIEVTIPWTLHLDSTPDKLGSSTVASVMYGPYVMAAEDNSTDWTTLILSETISDSIKISEDENNGFPILTAKGYTFRPMFAPEFASSRYTTYFKILLAADDGKQWFNVTVNNRTPLTGTITTTAQADMVKDGDDLVITLAPNDGYVVKKLIVNGEEVQDQVVDNTYILKEVSGDVAITVSFRPPVVDENNLEFAASLTCDTWYEYYGSPYDIMKDWEPKTSVDNYNGSRAYRNWYTKGQWSWLQYDWDDPMTISRFEVFWGTNDQNLPSWCDVPGDIRVEYLDEAGEWQVAELATAYEDMVKLNQYNTIKFAEKIQTTAVRLYIRTKNDSENSEAGCVGVLRWKAIGDVPEAVVDKTVEIAYFDFEEKNEDGTFSGGDYAVGTVTGTLEPEEFEGRTGHGLTFNGSSSIKVTDKDGGSLLTGYDEIAFSFDMKPNTGWSGWPFFANVDDQAPTAGGRSEHYLGGLVNENGLLVERYLNGRGVEGSGQTVAVGRDGWTHVDVIFGQEGTQVYLNYQLAGETACASSLTEILGDESTLYIGKALWGTEHYSGLLDNFGIYGKGTAKTVKISGKTELVNMETTKLTVDASPLYVTNMDELTWSSSDESVVTVEDGVVTAVGKGTATVTASIGTAEDSVEVTVSAIPAGSDFAVYAAPEASYTSSWEKLSGINNSAFEPEQSAFGTGKGWGNWPQDAGTVLWVTYTWSNQIKITSNEIYWYDDGGDTRVPSEISMEYLDADGNWQPITITSENYLQKDQYNTIDIEPVITSQIRLNVTIADNAMANGIGRWKVYGEEVGEESDPKDEAKEALKSEIAEAGKLNESDYTAESWAALQKAIADANEVLANANATADELTAAAQAIADAIEALVKNSGDEKGEDLALKATPSASYTPSWETIDGINNPDFEPAQSNFGTGNGWGNWDSTNAAGDIFWACYTWDSLVKITSNEIYWYDDGGGTLVPSEVTMEYLDTEGNWQPVTITSSDYLNKDQYNTIDIEPVTTTSIRINLTVAEGSQANGIGRWKVYGEEAGTPITPVDPNKEAKEALESAIAEAEALKEADYTAESWATLQTAITDAKAALKNTKVTADELAAAKAAIETAVTGLVKKTEEPDVDTKALEAVITSTEALKEADYTAESWTALQTALNDAKAVLAKEGATQAEIDAAASAVNAAVDALVKADVNVEPTPTPVHQSHVGKTFIVGNLKYKVTKDDASGREVRVTSLRKKVSTLTIPKKVTNKEWQETFKVTSIKAKAFKGQTMKKVIIGSNVTRIGPNAFKGCKKLTAVVIRKNVKTIGIRAFYGCTNLKKITIKGTALKTVKKNAFKRISKKAVIKVPKSKKNAYKKLLKGKIAKGVTIK